MTRRDFTKLGAAAPLALSIPAFARINSRIDGVMIGAQTYSFRDLPLDGCISGMHDIELGYAEFWIDKLWPQDPEKRKAWLTNPPMDEVKSTRKKFEDAGIQIYAVNYSFRDEWTDQQIEKG